MHGLVGQVPYLLSGATMLALAAWLLALNPPLRPHRVFAFLLIVRGLSLLDGFTFTHDPGAARILFGLESVTELLLPFAAVAFALLFPRARPLAFRRWTWAVLLGGAVAVLGTYFYDPAALWTIRPAADGTLAVDTYGPLNAVFFLQLPVYGLLSLLFALDYRRTAPGPLRQSLLMVSVGWGLLPAYMGFPLRVANYALGAPPYEIWGEPLAHSLVFLGFVSVLVGAIVILRSPHAPSSSGWRAFAGFAAAAVSRGLTGFWSPPLAGSLDLSDLVSNVWRLALPVLTTYAILRHHLFDSRSASRERRLFQFTASALGVLLVLLLGLLAWPRVGGPAPGLSASQSALIFGLASSLLVAPFAVRGVIRLRSEGAGRLGTSRDGRLDAYRAMLEILHPRGQLQQGAENLRYLRRILGVSTREHETLATLVAWQQSGQHPVHDTSAASPLSRFVVEQPLGEGSWGQAYLAADREYDRRVVLKCLRGAAARDPSARASLVRESRFLRRFRHPHIVSLLEVIDEPEPILVLEYVDGPSLASWMAGRVGTWTDALPIFRGILAGLAEIHAQGVLHRDIKPANILLTRSGEAKICDFGIALTHDLTRTLESAPGIVDVPGTLLYMSPEQARGARVDARSDLYGVGAVLYQFLTGQPARELDGMTATEARRSAGDGNPPPASDRIPPWAYPFLEKAMAADPGSRFQTAQEMADAMSRLGPEKDDIATSIPDPSRTPIVARKTARIVPRRPNERDSFAAPRQPETRPEYTRVRWNG